MLRQWKKSHQDEQERKELEAIEKIKEDRAKEFEAAKAKAKKEAENRK